MVGDVAVGALVGSVGGLVGGKLRGRVGGVVGGWVGGFVVGGSVEMVVVGFAVEGGCVVGLAVKFTFTTMFSQSK